MDRHTRRGLVAAGLVAGLTVLSFTGFVAWGALKHGRDEACVELTEVPEDAILLGESGPVLDTTDSLVPFGVWCRYETASGMDSVRFADLGTGALAVGVVLLVTSTVLAVRSPGASSLMAAADNVVPPGPNVKR